MINRAEPCVICARPERIRGTLAHCLIMHATLCHLKVLYCEYILPLCSFLYSKLSWANKLDQRMSWKLFLPTISEVLFCFVFFRVNRRPSSTHLCLGRLLSSRLIKSGPRFSRLIGRIMSRFLSDAVRMPEANLLPVSSQEGRLWISTSCNVTENVEGSWTWRKMP